MVVLAPIDLGAPELVLAAIGLDLLLMGFLVAVADAVEAGERLLPDLRRSLVAAVVAALLVGGPGRADHARGARAARWCWCCSSCWSRW